MGREVRRVPSWWQHPTNASGRPIPLFSANDYDCDHEDDETVDPDDFMLVNIPRDECTHWQMYETCSEGTPISPVFSSPEELARWLADTGASAFAGMTATYEQWLATIRRGSAPSAVLSSAGFESGVAAFGKDPEEA